MISFQDLNGIQVELSFVKESFPIKTMHVLVLAKYKNTWLLTKHPRRGIEFPGGKVEKSESLEEAAIRETLEETNVLIGGLEWIAEYMVHDEVPFSKAVFVASVLQIHEGLTSHETEGAVWLTNDEFINCSALSFHMKDAGMQAIIEKVKEYESKWKY